MAEPADNQPVIPQGGQPATPSVNNPPINPPANNQPAPNIDIEKTKGWTQDDWVKAYGEAQQKLGQNSKEVEQSREAMKQMNIVLAAIAKDPTRETEVKKWIAELDAEVSGKPTGNNLPDNQIKLPVVSPEVLDVRVQQESEIIRRFESKYGLDKLDKEKKAEIVKKIGESLKAVADPFDKYRDANELRSAIPISKFEDMMERAYWMANRDIVESRLKETDPTGGIMGPLPSISLPIDSVKLSPAEEMTAKKLGVDPEKYLARKKETLSSNKKGAE